MKAPTSRVREVARIAVPVSTEAIVLLLLNFVNQIIVGALGAVAIAAVGFANSLNFVVLITVSALGISVTILVARAAGAGRKHEMATTISSAVIVGALVSGVFAIAIAANPQSLLKLVGASANVASEGADYLRFIAISLIPLVVSAILSGVLRATGEKVEIIPSAKMSKSKKNVVDPVNIIQSFGADTATLFTVARVSTNPRAIMFRFIARSTASADASSTCRSNASASPSSVARPSSRYTTDHCAISPSLPLRVPASQTTSTSSTRSAVSQLWSVVTPVTSNVRDPTTTRSAAVTSSSSGNVSTQPVTLSTRSPCTSSTARRWLSRQATPVARFAHVSTGCPMPSTVLAALWIVHVSGRIRCCICLIHASCPAVSISNTPASPR